jgi:putative flippase GtrA
VSTDFATGALAPRYQHLFRYLLIGGMASAIDVLLFMALFNLAGTSTLAAHSVSVPTSVLVSFFVNARHNFHTDDHMALRLLSFVLVCSLGYLAGFGVISAASNLGLGANAGKILSLPVVFVVQFVLNSRITFRKSGPKGARA